MPDLGRNDDWRSDPFWQGEADWVEAQPDRHIAIQTLFAVAGCAGNIAKWRVEAILRERSLRGQGEL